MKIDFDRYRRTDGTLKLYDMFRENSPSEELTEHQMESVKQFVKAIEGIHRITSRQAAAIVLANAALLAMIMDPKWR